MLLTILFYVALIFTITQCFDSVPPETDMSTPEIIGFYGYPIEEILTITTDGYFLQMHRIRHGKNENKTDDTSRPVIFLQHGLGCSSSNWVANLPSQSAAFLFADAGFDVFMGNMRGNTYSKGHRKFDVDSRQYWAFRYDLDAMIDKALNMTGQSSLYYVGHSQGTLTMFTKLSIDPKFHKKGMYFLFGEREFLPSTWVTHLIARAVCGTWSINPFVQSNPLCGSVLFLIAGPDSHQLNKTRIPVFLSHVPAGTSTRNIMHWTQNVRSGLHQAFDLGSAEDNWNRYGNTIPPIYNISNIVNVSTYLYWSDDDWLSNSQDINEYLIPRLRPSVLVQNTKLRDFNHLDFIWGMRAAREIYKPIIDIIMKETTPTKQ